ncbi:alpha/beta hydrolase [Lutimonas saemankumensis]|uniref:alpha/beta hydrolase n=1 Tax=Lutimonas saemankumensis TaxID=483016 RepID=UPI001CD46FEB|nr:alpha/beta hydrolase-fold protein [Lutimonas saemankumensis]MCA0932764.1 alpha/beta hydrolase [Lutimonas saemankumensis]
MRRISCSYHYVYLFFFAICSNLVSAQVTFVIDEIPENTPVGEKIFISGNFEGWTGGQDKYKMKSMQGKYVYTFNEMDERPIEFKFTRGSWATVEVDHEGLQMENRTYSFKRENDTVNLSISRWHDFSPAKSTASKNVRVLDENFDMLPLNKKRRIWIYLPEEYENDQKKYPVLYMHDGQNLFDATTSFSGEWQVDETLDKLKDSIGLELIVVAIDHGGAERIDEYSPWNLENYPTNAEGDQYVRFISENLKPYVDENYRTLKEAENTGIMGSSLGGLISFYTAIEYPEVFGIAGIFSPSFPLVDEEIEISQRNPELQKLRIYFMSGGREGHNVVKEMKLMSEKMIQSGIPVENIYTRVNPVGEHNEKLWKAEFERAVIWLFEPKT